MNENDSKYEHYRLIVSKEQSPIRIDKYICSKIKYATRNKVQNAIKNKNVLVNENPIKNHYYIKPDDIITILFSSPPKEKTNIDPQNIKLDIVYEDNDFIVINKPSGMLTHPSLSVYKDTLLNALIFYFKNLEQDNLLDNVGLVHRLDKYTSGLIIIAKTVISLKTLTEQFLNHSIKRKYIALVHGKIRESEGTINAPIENNISLNRVNISKKGKRAVTHFRVLKTNEHFSLIECELETGRTHQIRVHLEYLGFPLVGENVYIKANNYNLEIKNKVKIIKDGQFLHSYYIKFFHPVLDKYIEIISDIPDTFKNLIDY